MHISSLILLTSTALAYAKPVTQATQGLAARIPQGTNPSITFQDCLASNNVPVFFPASADFSQYADPYNLRLVYTPAVIVVPTTNEQVADAVVCAGQSGVKVQAKSGGREY